MPALRVDVSVAEVAVSGLMPEVDVAFSILRLVIVLGERLGDL